MMVIGERTNKRLSNRRREKYLNSGAANENKQEK